MAPTINKLTSDYQPSSSIFHPKSSSMKHNDRVTQPCTQQGKQLRINPALRQQNPRVLRRGVFMNRKKSSPNWSKPPRQGSSKAHLDSFGIFGFKEFIPKISQNQNSMVIHGECWHIPPPSVRAMMAFAFPPRASWGWDQRSCFTRWFTLKSH